MVAVLAAAFLAGAFFVGDSSAAARRVRPAAAVVSISLPLLFVTVDGASAAGADALDGVAFALLAAFFGGIVVVVVKS